MDYSNVAIIQVSPIAIQIVFLMALNDAQRVLNFPVEQIRV